MAEIIQRHALDAIVVDPLYLSLFDGSENGKPSDLFFMGSKLLPLSELGQASGCTIVVLHHFERAAMATARRYARGAESSGVAEWPASGFSLLADRSTSMTAGMNFGCVAGALRGTLGSTAWTLTRELSTRTRRPAMEVEVEPGHQVMQTARIDRVTAKAERQREEDEAGQKAVVEALAKLPKPRARIHQGALTS